MVEHNKRKGGPYWGEITVAVGDSVLLGVEKIILDTVRSKKS
jgi:hypothetical protein